MFFFLCVCGYSNSHHQGEIEETDIRPLFEPLLHQYGVDVLFAGHVHAYERTYPVLNGKLAPPGTSSFIEINIGDGGNREGPALPWCTPISSFPWSAYRDAVFGHGSYVTAAKIAYIISFGLHSLTS